MTHFALHCTHTHTPFSSELHNQRQVRSVIKYGNVFGFIWERHLIQVSQSATISQHVDWYIIIFSSTWLTWRHWCNQRHTKYIHGAIRSKNLPNSMHKYTRNVLFSRFVLRWIYSDGIARYMPVSISIAAAAVFSFLHKRPDKIPLSVGGLQLLPMKKNHLYTKQMYATVFHWVRWRDTMKNIIYIFIDAFPSSRQSVSLSPSIYVSRIFCLSLSST